MILFKIVLISSENFKYATTKLNSIFYCTNFSGRMKISACWSAENGWNICVSRLHFLSNDSKIMSPDCCGQIDVA